MGQKGNNFVEYALMLALVVGIGWGVLGSYGDGIPGIFGSAAELLQAGSKSDKAYDRHMKWLQDTLKDTEAGFQSFAGYMGGTNGKYFDQRKVPEFTTTNGLIDSDSGSHFVGQIDSSALQNDSWAILDKQQVGTTDRTDVYRVDPNATTDAITLLASSAQMKVAENTRKDGSTYRVLRDLK